MKRIYYLLVSFAVFACIFSCSKSENFSERDESANDLIVSEFSCFNDSLLKTDYYVSTRGFWDGFKRGLVVSAADIGGAGGGIAATKEIVGLFGAVSGGTGAVVACGVIVVVCGAGASIAAAQALNYAVYEEPVQVDEVIELYYDVKDLNVEYVKLDLPKEFEYLNLIGGMHNSILKQKERSGSVTRSGKITRSNPVKDEILNEGNLEMIDEVNTIEFRELEHNILTSDEFRGVCSGIVDAVDKSYSNGNFSNDTFFSNIEGQPTEKEKIIYDLYQQIFKEYPNNVNDVVFIANEYVKRIEKMNVFSKSEKENLYLSLSVSVNSAYYWNQ